MNDNDRSITTLTALSHAIVHTYELSIPIFITVWLAEFSTTKFTLGLVATIGYGLFGLGGIPAGVAADKYNPKNLLLVAVSIMGFAFILLGLSTNLVTLTLAVGVWGIAASIHHPSSLSLISRSVSKRGHSFAYHGMAGNFGIAFGPFITSLMLTFLSWRTVSFGLAIPALLISLFGLRLTIRTQTKKSSSEENRDLSINSISDFFTRSWGLISSVYGILLIIVMLEGLYYRGILTFLPEFFTGLPQVPSITIEGLPFETGRYLYAGMLMVGMAGQYLGGRLTDNFNPLRVLTIILLLLAVLAFAFVPIETYPFFVVVIICSAVGLTLFSAQPLYQATIAEYTPEGSRGLAYGFSFFGIFGVGALGAGLSGYILSNYNPQTLFVVLASLILTAALMLVGIGFYTKS